MPLRRHRHLRPVLVLLAGCALAAGAAFAGVPAFAAARNAANSSSGGSGAASSRVTGGSSAAGGAQGSTRPKASGPDASTATGTGVAQSAIATWYGPGLYGNKTACGQTLTPAVIGLANRTLPCGTLVKVAYDGRSRVVPVIDRGPYADNGASWDLTAGAANALEITETVRISTSVVGAVPNSLTLGSPAATSGEAALGGAQAR